MTPDLLAGGRGAARRHRTQGFKVSWGIQSVAIESPPSYEWKRLVAAPIAQVGVSMAFLLPQL